MPRWGRSNDVTRAWQSDIMHRTGTCAHTTHRTRHKHHDSATGEATRFTRRQPLTWHATAAASGEGVHRGTQGPPAQEHAPCSPRSATPRAGPSNCCRTCARSAGRMHPRPTRCQCTRYTSQARLFKGGGRSDSANKKGARHGEQRTHGEGWERGTGQDARARELTTVWARARGCGSWSISWLQDAGRARGGVGTAVTVLPPRRPKARTMSPHLQTACRGAGRGSAAGPRPRAPWPCLSRSP